MAPVPRRKNPLHTVALLSALAVSATAVAQNLTIPEGSEVWSADDCGAEILVTWHKATTSGTCSPLEIWATDGSSCGNLPAEDEPVRSVNETTFFNSSSGTVTFTVAELPGVASAEVACGEEPFEQDYRLCAAIDVVGGFTFDCSDPGTVRGVSPPVVRYDALPPEAPTLESLTPLDGALTAHYTLGADVVEVQAFTRREGEAEFEEAGNAGSDQNTLRIEDLENGISHEVRLEALDEAGNRSAPSAVLTETPVQSRGFFERYRNAGGAEVGCAAAGGAPAPFALLLLLGSITSLRTLRRRR